MENKDFTDLCFEVAHECGYQIFSLEEKFDFLMEGLDSLRVYFDDEFSQELTDIDVAYRQGADINYVVEDLKDYFNNLSEYEDASLDEEDIGNCVLEPEKMEKLIAILDFIEENEDYINNIIENQKNVVKDYKVKLSFKDDIIIPVEARSEEEAVNKAYALIKDKAAKDFLKKFTIED